MLLYTADDVERQFGLVARSRLTRSEIHGTCRALRNLKTKNDRSVRGRDSEVVATPGEILLEHDEHAFRRDTNTDDTRIKTAIAWLEDARLVQRDENRAEIFASSLLVSTLDEAKERLARIDERHRPPLVRIVERLINAPIDEGVSTDELMALSGLSRGRRSATRSTTLSNSASRTTTRRSPPTSTRASNARRRDALRARSDSNERSWIACGNWPRIWNPQTKASVLHLRPVTQALKDDGHEGVLPLLVLRLLRSLSMDGPGEDGPGSIDLRQSGPRSGQRGN